MHPWICVLPLVTACRPQSAPVAPSDPAPPPASTGTNQATAVASPPGQAIATSDPDEVTGPGTPLPAADDRRRAEGLHALDEGRFTEARRIFAELLAKHRENASLQALVDAAEEAERQAREGAALVLSRMPAQRLPAPPWSYSLRKRAPVEQASRAPKLVQVSQKRNSITDDEAWFAEHGLALPTWQVPNQFRRTEGDLPQQIPTKYGDLPIVTAISHPDHAILLYGPDYGGGTVVAVVAGDGQIRALLDMSAYRTASRTKRGDESFVDQRITWAQAVGDVLYVSSGHRTYASSSGGANAFITALDLRTGDLLWRSETLVANSRNFLVQDGFILTGYGFTAEPDFVYVLDGATGRTVAKHKVKSGPDFLLLKDEQLYVRCYDTDYVFDVR